MGEPLKKVYGYLKDGVWVYTNKQIGLAVEWFEEEIKRLNKETTSNIHKDSVLDTLRRTFPDLNTNSQTNKNEASKSE